MSLPRGLIHDTPELAQTGKEYVLQLAGRQGTHWWRVALSASQPCGSAISGSLASAVQEGTRQTAYNQVIARKVRIRTAHGDVDMHHQSHPVGERHENHAANYAFN